MSGVASCVLRCRVHRSLRAPPPESSWLGLALPSQVGGGRPGLCARELQDGRHQGRGRAAPRALLRLLRHAHHHPRPAAAARAHGPCRRGCGRDQLPSPAVPAAGLALTARATCLFVHAAELRGVFTSFASFGSRVELPDIDNARFYKLTKDCGLTAANVGGRPRLACHPPRHGCPVYPGSAACLLLRSRTQLTSTDVDIIFAKAKAKGARRMTFEQFISALSMCADKKVRCAKAFRRGRCGSWTVALPLTHTHTRACAGREPRGRGAQGAADGRPRGARHQARHRAPARRQGERRPSRTCPLPLRHSQPVCPGAQRRPLAPSLLFVPARPQSTYSGVYQRGGPRAVDPPKNDLASFLDRSDADVRGVKKTPPAPK